MSEIRCIDETLDLNSTLSYHLSIQVGLDGFSFCILNSVNNKYIVLNHYSFTENSNTEITYEKIEKILNDEELLNQEYKSVNIIYKSEKYTLIPNELFDVKNLRLFFEYNHILNDLDELHYTALKNIEATCLFSIPNQISNPLINKFKKCKIYHSTTPFIENALNYANNKPEDKYIFVNINNAYIDMLAVNKGELLLHNCFFYNSDNDILFYIIYILKQLNWNIEDINLICTGNITKASNSYKIIQNHINQVKLQILSKIYIYSYTFNKINILEFYNLLNLNSCV